MSYRLLGMGWYDALIGLGPSQKEACPGKDANQIWRNYDKQGLFLDL